MITLPYIPPGEDLERRVREAVFDTPESRAKTLDAVEAISPGLDFLRESLSKIPVIRVHRAVDESFVVVMPEFQLLFSVRVFEKQTVYSQLVWGRHRVDSRCRPGEWSVRVAAQNDGVYIVEGMNLFDFVYNNSKSGAVGYLSENPYLRGEGYKPRETAIFLDTPRMPLSSTKEKPDVDIYEEILNKRGIPYFRDQEFPHVHVL